MAWMLLQLVTAVAAILVQPVHGQSCSSVPNIAELSSLIRNARVVGDNPSFTATAIEANFVCLRPVVPSNPNGNLIGVSVVVNYTCTGGTAPQCNSQPVVSQFDFQCVAGQWSNSVFFRFQDIITENPIANFTTANRSDCLFCANEILIQTSGLPPGLMPDVVTHCVRKLFC